MRFTLKLSVAGVRSVLPRTTAATANLCRPLLALNFAGELHGAKRLSSNLQRNFAPGLLALKAYLTAIFRLLVLIESLGLLVICVVGRPM